MSLTLAACGGVADDLVESLDEDDGTVEQPGGDEHAQEMDGLQYGDALEATVTVSGPMDATFGDDPDISYWLPAGCADSPDPDLRRLDVSIVIEDLTVESAARPGARVLTIDGKLEEDLFGGVTGTFDMFVTVDAHDPPGTADPARYSGTATLDILRHDVPQALLDRRMHFTLTASGLEPPRGSDIDPLDVEADVLWVMGCRA